MKEKDQFEKWDENSNTVKFDCDKIGIREDTFQIGDDPSMGTYNLITEMTNAYDAPQFGEDFRVFSPVTTDF